MRKLLAAIIVLLLSAGAAVAQVTGMTQPYTEPTLTVSTNGYSLTGRFSTTASQFPIPYMRAYWIQLNDYSRSTSWVLDTLAGIATGLGFTSETYYTGNDDFAWKFNGIGGNSSGCLFRGQSCVRLQFVNDKNWHNACNLSSRGCTDSGPNNEPLLDEPTLATVAITSPANGSTGLTGSVPIAATCSDPIAVKQVVFYVDGAALAAGTAALTATWNSTTAIDGSHSISATCTNVGGLSATSSVTVSTTNGVTAKTYYIATAGNDSTNTCLSTAAPCATPAGVFTRMTTNPLHGGDSILFHAGDTIAMAVPDSDDTKALTLIGPSVPTSLFPTQNTYPGQTITIGTYGGSGNCMILAGVTTDCATLKLSTNTLHTCGSGVGNTGCMQPMVQAINVPNVVIQNIRIIGTGMTTALCSGCGVGIKIGTGGRYNNTGAVVQNVEVLDFNTPIYVSHTTRFDYPTSGVLCNATVQNTYAHGSTFNTTIGTGISIVGANCGGSGTGANIVSNYTNNTGGDLNQTNGSGILFVNGSVNIVDIFNVTSNSTGNLHSCGSGYGNWWYQTRAGAVKGNESLLNGPQGQLPPGSPGGCDAGAYNLDHGTSFFNVQYNYAHEAYGPCMNMLGRTVSGYTSGGNTIAYNIFENCDRLTHDGNSNMLGGNQGVAGPLSVYNNTLWNGYNGTPDPIPARGTYITQIAAIGFGGYCPVTNWTVANNLIVANNKGGTAEMLYMPMACYTSVAFRSNNYWPLAGNPYFKSVGNAVTGPNFFSVSDWNAASGDTGVQVNPNFTAPGGGNSTVCWPTLSGIPTQPGAKRCPNNYTLPTGNTLIGAGTNLASAPYNLTPPTQDFHTNAIPNGVGTGYNIGSDGAHH